MRVQALVDIRIFNSFAFYLVIILSGIVHSLQSIKLYMYMYVFLWNFRFVQAVE